jgi:ubiquinone/menaquinone biosynthesis C-methylase UbiE
MNSSKSLGPTSLSEFESFLIDFHAKYPSCTPIVFADGRTAEGLSSYDILGKLVQNEIHESISILDLACGDGFFLETLARRNSPNLHLSGLDMSEGELTEAKKKLAKYSIPLLQGKAQDIPLKSSVLDYVFCHMAFMLMDDIEDVVREIHRVLKPGGVFSAVIGRQGRSGPVYDEYLRLLSESLEEEGKSWTLKCGDKRVRSEEGLQSLFEKGFDSQININDFVLHFTNDPESAIPFFLLMYDVGLLSEVGRNRLREKLLQSFRTLVSSDGKLELTMSMRQFTVSRSKNS